MIDRRWNSIFFSHNPNINDIATMEEDRGPVVVGVATVFAFVTAVAILLRLWARTFIVKSVGADDGKTRPTLRETAEPAADGEILALICIAAVSLRIPNDRLTCRRQQAMAGGE